MMILGVCWILLGVCWILLGGVSPAHRGCAAMIFTTHPLLTS
jgi:hypothetical protein